MDETSLQLETYHDAVADLVETRGSRAYMPAFAGTWPFGFYPVGARELELLAGLIGVDLGPDYGMVMIAVQQALKPKTPSKARKARKNVS
jgi:hypothetical protein